MKEFNSKYVLNPIYSLRLDVNRVLLSSVKGGNVFIHPIYAILLSKFVGDLTLQQVIDGNYGLFNCSKLQMNEIVMPFIENKERLNVLYDGNVFVFPKNILIENEDGIKRTDLKTDSFLIYPPYDFVTRRLHIPNRILIVINTICVTDCVYCYANRKYKYIPVKTEKIIKLINDAYKYGIDEIDFSGGEFFLHKDWNVILKEIVKCKYKPHLTTKVPLSEKIIDELDELGLKDIQISLDSIDSGLQKVNLCVSADYVRLIKETIKYLDEKGFCITIKSTLTNKTCNIENIEELLSFLNQFINVKRYIFTPAGYSHYKTLYGYINYKPTLSQVENIVETISKKEANYNFEISWDLGASKLIDLYKNKLAFNARPICSANLYALVVLPDGKVTICEELYWNDRFIVGDINENDIIDIWNSKRAKLLANLDQSLFPEDSACKLCDDFKKCRFGKGVCWKHIIAFFGDDNWLYPDPKCPKSPNLSDRNKQFAYEKN